VQQSLISLFLKGQSARKVHEELMARRVLLARMESRRLLMPELPALSPRASQLP
jgi:hypothetical protein